MKRKETNGKPKGKPMAKEGESRLASKGDLHEEAEACRAWARAECERRNAAAQQAVVAAFEAGEIAQLFREEGQCAIGRLVFRMREVRRGEPSDPMGVRASTILSRLLGARTTVEYGGWWFDPLLDDGAIVRFRRARALLRNRGTMLAQTEASHVQALLRKALFDYAFAAAAFAKHKKSASLFQWVELVDALNRTNPHAAYAFAEDDARHLAALEKSASDCLRFEAIIARLPKFKKTKAVR